MAWLGISARKETVRIDRGGWLDAMRFIVAFLIILHHYQIEAPIPLVNFHPVFERGYLLTDFFLIDSGYVLGRIYGERVLSGRMSRMAFYLKRWFRLIPAHLLMSILLLGVVGTAALLHVAPRHPEWLDWRQLPAQFFLVQAYWVPGGYGWNAPTWSISALLGCYLCFPYLLRLTLRLSPWSALMTGAVVLLGANLLTTTLLGYPIYQMPMGDGFIRALPLFLLGMALASFAQRVFVPERLARAAGVAALLALIGFQFYGRFSLVSLALISLMILAAGAIPVRRKSKLVEKAAVVSFSMFITNEVVRTGYFGVVHAAETRLHLSPPIMWGLWAGGVAAALIFAVVFHYLVDMPTQRYCQRWTSPKREPVAAEAPAPSDDPEVVPAI